MPRVKELTGMRFGRLVALKHIGLHSSGQALWRCVCDCGRLKDVPSSKLVRLQTRSCGCLLLETQRTNGKKEPGYAARAMVYREYKKGAKRRNLVFDEKFPITEERKSKKVSTAWFMNSDFFIFRVSSFLTK